MVLFELFLLNKSFLCYYRLKLQKQLFISRIKALLIKVPPLYIKILKAKNFILAIFAFLNIKFKYLNLKKNCKKLDNRSYQVIYIGYKNTNQYWVYNSHSSLAFIIKDVF